MDGNIELQWIRENLLYKKKVKIDIKDLEKLKQKLKKSENIKEIYINFDRNKHKNISQIWVGDVSARERSVIFEDDKSTYLKISEYCH